MNKQEQLDYLAKHASPGERLGLGNLMPLFEAMIEAQTEGTPEIYSPVLKFSKIGVDRYAYVGDTATVAEYLERVTADITGTPAVRVALVPLQETGGWTGSDPMTSSDPWTETDPMTSSDPWTETDPMTSSDPWTETDPMTSSDPWTETDPMTRADISADAAEAPEIKPLTLAEIAGIALNADLPATVILFTHVEVSEGSVVALQDDAQGGQWQLKVTAAYAVLTYLTPPRKIKITTDKGTVTMNMTRTEYSENLYNALPLSLNLNRSNNSFTFCDSCGVLLGERKDDAPRIAPNCLLYQTVPDNSGRLYGVTTQEDAFPERAWPLTEQSEALSAIIDFGKANVLSLEKA